MTMKHDYAREKLTLLLRDLDSYNGDEFWRQMSRIADGATQHPSAELLLEAVKTASEERDAMAAHVERLRNAINVATDEHIAFAKRMALGSNATSMQAIDKADALLVHESFHVPVDTTCLLMRDTHQQVKALSDAAEALIKDFNATDTLTANQVYQRLADRSRELRRTIEEKETTPCPTQS